MDERIAAARARLGKTTVLLGHHYQRDEVIRFADFTGDSYKLSKIAAETDARIHRLLRRALHGGERGCAWARAGQQVILPDLNAGCSMADMAEIGQVEDCWESLERLGLTARHDSADLHEFDRCHQGLLRRARRTGLHLVQRAAAFDWAFARGEKILFLPDQHLGRNTAYAMGIPLNEMVVWDPWQINGGVCARALARGEGRSCGRGIARFTSAFCRSHVDAMRAKYPGIQVIVHPECRWEVCQKADALGSTERLIKLVREAPAGTIFAVGTEIHLVNRLAQQFAVQRASTSSRSTIQAASARRCIASRRNTWRGRSRTWWRAVW